MAAKELETIAPLHYSTVDVNGGLSGPSFPEVHNKLLCFAHIEGEVVVLAPHCQFSDHLPIGRLIVGGDQAVVASANLVMVLESWSATQSWVNREYRRGLRTHP